MSDSQHHRHSGGRASLGAMSWNLPNDDWRSPWSFEDEWIPPEPGWQEKAQLGQGTEAGQMAVRSARAAKVESIRPPSVSVVPEVPLPNGTLRFEVEEPVEDPPTRPLVKVPAPLPTAAPATEDARFRPPEIQPRNSKATVTSLSAPVPPKTASESLPKTNTVAAPVNEETHRIHKRKKIPRRSNSFSWGTLVSLSLGTLGFTLLAWIYLHDAPRESDEDLRPQVVIDQTPTTQAQAKMKAFLDSIVPVENAFFQSQSPWTWDTPSLSSFIRSNGTAFDNLRDLLEDFDWHPHHSEWHQEDLSRHPIWPHVAYLLQAQSAYLARRGDEVPAFSAAIDLAEFSRRLQEVWAWPGYMQRAFDLQAASVQLLAELLKTTRLDSAALARFQVEFTQCQPDDDLMRQACAAYYIHEKKLLLGPASGELLDTMPEGRMHQRPGRLFFKMNETLGLFASAFRDLRDEMTRPPYTRLSVGAGPSIRLSAPRFYHPNSSGESYFSARIEPHLQWPEDHSMSKARHGLVRCLFALRRYLTDRHSLPGQLSDLTPNYLTTIPQDPFSGESFHYESATGLLYSVGINLIPEGGKPTQPPLNDDREPTVELGISQAVPVKK